MPVAHRSLRVTPADLARVEALRDRCGPRTSASEAVRAALAWFTARATQIEDVTPAADQLVTEAGEPGGKVWGISLTESEALALDELVAKPPAGLRRKFSRNEAVRLAVLLCSQAGDDEVKAADAATARLARGRAKSPSA
jgi:Arc/MetJ-type ribon-helix-helix transcriptional regulator